jgi:hypothetical protein
MYIYIYIFYTACVNEKKKKKSLSIFVSCRDEMWWFDYLYLSSGLLSFFFLLIWLELIRLSLTLITLFRTTSINYLSRRCFSFVIVSTSAINKILLSNMPTPHIYAFDILWTLTLIQEKREKKRGKITECFGSSLSFDWQLPFEYQSNVHINNQNIGRIYDWLYSNNPSSFLLYTITKSCWTGLNKLTFNQM